MSNPVATPPPPQFSPLPPLPPPRHRSFAGPFVLIIVGIVFLLSTMGMLSWAKLAHLFANYWPVLLILWGIMKMIEHQRARSEGARASGIGAGGVLLIVMIVMFGLIANQVDRHWRGWREDLNFDDGDFKGIFGGDTFNYNDHLEQNFPGDATLKVINNHGAVSVHASSDDKVTVVVRKRIGAENQGDADKYNNDTKPTITTIGGLVTVNANADAGNHPVETDLDISLPRKAPVTITSHRGDVNVSGRNGNVDISAQHSDTTVDDINANVKVTQEKGTIKIEQVSGDVQVGGKIGEVTLADIKGSAQLEGEFQESVKLERIAKTVTFKSSRTDMEFSHIAGSLNLDSDELRADEITGPLHLSTRSKNIRLDAVSGDVRLKDDNGSVELTMRTLGNVQIDNRNGDVQLEVPEKAGFRLDASTRSGGEIQSDFSELKINNDEHESRASGSVGNGSSHIVINNEHEGIEIRKASATPPQPPTPPNPGKPAKLPASKGNPEPTDN